MNDYALQLKTNEFQDTVKFIAANYEFDEIIETGTFDGDGSTVFFAQTGKYVFTIECHYQHFQTATKNLLKYPNVCVIHGLSLDRNYLIKGLLNEKFDIDTLYDSKYPKTFYMREISQTVTLENALDVFSNNARKQLIFLDSAGGTGYLEFKYVMSFPPEYLKNKILMLDDISHIKHIRSVNELSAAGYKVILSSDKRFAWCDMGKTAGDGRNVIYWQEH